MTRTTIHDEAQIDDTIEKIRDCYVIVDSNGNGEGDVREIIKQYAEHYLIKHFDSEIERKKVQRQNKRCGACDGAKVGHAMFCTIIDEDEKYLQSLKAELQNNG